MYNLSQLKLKILILQQGIRTLSQIINYGEHVNCFQSGHEWKYPLQLQPQTESTVIKLQIPVKIDHGSGTDPHEKLNLVLMLDDKIFNMIWIQNQTLNKNPIWPRLRSGSDLKNNQIWYQIWITWILFDNCIPGKPMVLMKLVFSEEITNANPQLVAEATVTTTGAI